MKYLHVNTKVLTFILFFLLLLPSCNNEEIFVVEESAIIAEETAPTEEETPNTEDAAPAIDAVDDSVNTLQHVPVDIEAYLNDINLPESITLSNTNPSNGVLAINNNETPDNLIDDTVVYTPNSGFSGIDSFDYTVCDATNAENCDTATVTITIEPIEEDIATELKAFPTAYGAGAYTTGGRGGTVIHVTNLNDSGTGSLREALTQTYTRYIVFDVSGVIELNSQIGLGSSNSNFTVNGFSAPNGGITIIGYNISCDKVDNQIWRGIKFRNGYKNTDTWYQVNLRIRGGSNAIVDRCSFGYSKYLGFSFNTSTSGTDEYGDNGTFQNCIYGHSKLGVLVGNSSGSYFGSFSFLRNVSVGTGHRHPKAGGEIDLDVINNYIYNWEHRIIRLDPYDYKLNLIGNYFQAGNSTRLSDNDEIIFTTGTNGSMSPQIWDEDNSIGAYTYNSGASTSDPTPSGYPTNPANAWHPFYNSTVAVNSSWFSSTRLSLEGEAIPILSASSLEAELFPKVGASEYIDDNGNVQFYRDALDVELIQLATDKGTEVKKSSSLYEAAAEALSPPTNTRPGSYDTDNDGMADVWETAIFGDLTKTAIGDEDSDGYTNIEEFLNKVDK